MKSKLTAFVVLCLSFAFLVSSCGSPSEEVKTLRVPTYATFEGVMEQVQSEGNFGTYWVYINRAESSIGDSVEEGYVGALISVFNLDDFTGKDFENWGQHCHVSQISDLRSRDYRLVVDVKTTTSDPNFVQHCDDQIPATVKAIMVEASEGDGDFLISYREVDLNIKIKVKE